MIRQNFHILQTPPLHNLAKNWCSSSRGRQSMAHKLTPNKVVWKQKDFAENLAPPLFPRLLHPGIKPLSIFLQACMAILSREDFLC